MSLGGQVRRAAAAALPKASRAAVLDAGEALETTGCTWGKYSAETKRLFVRELALPRPSRGRELRFQLDCAIFHFHSPHLFIQLAADRSSLEMDY